MSLRRYCIILHAAQLAVTARRGTWSCELGRVTLGKLGKLQRFNVPEAVPADIFHNVGDRCELLYPIIREFNIKNFF